MPACLFATSGHRCELPPRAAVIGTDSGCDVPLAGLEGVAPRHCELRPAPHGMELIKLDHAALLHINGAPVITAFVSDGDVITIGSIPLLLRLPQAATAPIPIAPEVTENLTETEEKKRRAQQLMEENWRRTQERYEEFRRKQSFPLAVIGAVLGILVGSIGFRLTSTTGWRAYVFLIIAVGFVVGWLIRLLGRGVDRRFGVLGATAAILGVFASTGFDSYMYLRHGTAFPTEATEISAEEKARAEQTRLENERRSTLIAAEAAEMDKIGRRKLHEDDPFNVLDSKRNEDMRFRDEILAEANAPTAELHAAGFFVRLLGPKHLAAYLLAGIAAYRASFRFLSNVEASNLHFQQPSASAETRAKTLRDRLEIRS